MENDELAQHLDALKREDCYRVDAVLKQSAHETTQRVFFVGENGAETGPYIRKFIQQTPGMGVAYEHIFAAQQQGRRFKHLPNILECYSRDSLLVVVMEYVRGETLQDAVYRMDPSVELATNIFPQLCDAVGELHEEFDPAIIHRDLKPSNIILSDGGLAIIDFGIAREFKSDSDSDTSHFGTRGFAPPEQFGFGQTTVRSDIYSLGMVLYYCLTETIPDNAMRERGFADSRIPDSIRQVIIKAAAFDPRYRYGSAVELKEAFLKAARNAQQRNAAAASGAGVGRETAPSNAMPANGSGGDARGDVSATGSSTANGQSQRGSRGRAAILIAILAACVVAGIAFAVGVMGQSSQAPVTSSDKTALQENEEPSAKANTAGDVSKGDSSSSTSDNASNGESASNSASSTATSVSGVSASGSAPSDDATASASNGSTAAEQAAEVISISAPKKNAFDPATNIKITVAGIEFQVPRYFQTKTQSTDTSKNYYAETGSSTAMLMTTESVISDDAGYSDVFHLYDEFLSGVMKGNGNFDNLSIVADCDLAGYPARIATFTGVIKELPVKMEIAVFYNPSIKTVGALMFGQTENAQFDYRDDVAKIITSAAPAKAQ